MERNAYKGGHQMVNTTPYRVYYNDTDAGKVVYFGNYTKLIEMGFSEWFRQYSNPIKELNDKYGTFLVVKESSLQYKQPIYYDELIHIQTSVMDIKYTSITFATKVFSHNKLCFKGQTALVLVDADTGKPTIFQDEILKLKDVIENENDVN
jgi:acyl-CoA thioester hydrolase